MWSRPKPTTTKQRNAMSLSVVDFNAIAGKLERPFALSSLATVGDLSLSA